MQNKGYYAVQGHSRSRMSVPIESLYATSYLWLILMTYYLVPFRSYRRLLFKFWSFAFMSPFGT